MPVSVQSAWMCEERGGEVGPLLPTAVALRAEILRGYAALNDGEIGCSDD
ncbi:MAG: hypothetical protein M9909_05205 [Thermomicrobiales bacterium]|nr:hypothetical protein [Thermomicrobiales bacterium]